MPEQRSFWPPASHATDPHTSRDAEVAATESGSRSRHCDIVLAALAYWSFGRGLTASELSERIDEMDLQEVRRRLTDLKALGRVTMGPSRTVAGRRRAECTWLTI